MSGEQEGPRKAKWRPRWWMYGLASLAWAGIAVWGMVTESVDRQATGLIGAVAYAFLAGLLVFYVPSSERKR